MLETMILTKGKKKVETLIKISKTVLIYFFFINENYIDIARIIFVIIGLSIQK